MKIFLTGATGYVGSSLLPALVEAGHSVTALVRDQAKADRVGGDRVTAVVADMRDQDVVRRLAGEADAVIATASPGDASSEDADKDFIAAVLEGLTPGSTFIRTGGVWVHGSGADLTEDSPIDAPSLTAWRQPLDEGTLAAEGIRSILVEPGIVYGHGSGIPATVTAAEQTDGDEPALALVGPGTQHWTTVHVDDLAALYVAALERGQGGARYLGVSGQNPTVRELGEAASRRRGLDGRVAPETAEQATERLGAFGEALLLDQQATGEKARTELGWTPTQPSLLSEIESGGYDQS